MIAVTAIKDLQLETSINDAYICLLEDSIDVAENGVSNNHYVSCDLTLTYLSVLVDYFVSFFTVTVLVTGLV